MSRGSSSAVLRPTVTAPSRSLRSYVPVPRTWAYLLDAGVAGGLTFLSLRLLDALFSTHLMPPLEMAPSGPGAGDAVGSTVRAGLSGVTGLVVLFVYLTIAEWRTGTTLGKYVLGLRVVSDDGRVAWWQAVLRNACKVFAPYLVLRWTSASERGVHDRLARTTTR